MRNKMREVAELLGVPFTEDMNDCKYFEVYYDDLWYKVYICKNGIVWGEGENERFNNCILVGILSGNIECRILPFIPKLREKYWCVQFCGQGKDKNIYVDEFTYAEDICDYQNISMGNCFQCKADADKMKYKIYKQIAGKDWE